MFKLVYVCVRVCVYVCVSDVMPTNIPLIVNDITANWGGIDRDEIMKTDFHSIHSILNFENSLSERKRWPYTLRLMNEGGL